MKTFRIAIVIFLFALASCSSSETDWEKVAKHPSVESLQAFVGKYPTSSHAEEARAQIDKLLWTAATNAPSIQGYTKYLAECPQGRHTVAAQYLLKTLQGTSIYY